VLKTLNIKLPPHLCIRGSSAILGCYVAWYEASRRKRGSVVFRPRLSTGLALSLLCLKPSAGLLTLLAVYHNQGILKPRSGAGREGIVYRAWPLSHISRKGTSFGRLCSAA
jgi:hypothetical protein